MRWGSRFRLSRKLQAATDRGNIPGSEFVQSIKSPPRFLTRLAAGEPRKVEPDRLEALFGTKGAKPDLEGEAPHQGRIEMVDHVGGTDENTGIALHCREQLVCQALPPFAARGAPVVKETVGLVDKKHALPRIGR